MKFKVSNRNFFPKSFQDFLKVYQNGQNLFFDSFQNLLITIEFFYVFLDFSENWSMGQIGDGILSSRIYIMKNGTCHFDFHYTPTNLLIYNTLYLLLYLLRLVFCVTNGMNSVGQFTLPIGCRTYLHLMNLRLQ